SIQASRVYSPASEVATDVDGGYPVESRCLAAELRIARANTVKGVPFPADKKIAVRVHIECSVDRPTGNSDGTLPGHSAVCGALELHAAAATVNAIVRLVLKPMPRAVGLVDSKPLFVPAAGASVG